MAQQGNNLTHDKSADELLSFLTSNQDLYNNNFMYSDPLNGPDLSSIMFDNNIVMEEDKSTKNQHSS
jgi:hypothetical protein